MRRARWIR